MSRELLEKADKILTDANLPDRHSYFQIEKFIIGKEATTQAQLWQIVREIQTRRESVDSMTSQLEDAEDELELLDINIERKNIQIRLLAAPVEGTTLPAGKEMIRLEIQEHEINIRKLERQKVSLIKSAKSVQHKMKGIMEEMNCLIAAYDKVIGVAGELLKFDNIESQRDMWNEKFLEEFNLRILLKRPLETEFVKSVLALDDGAAVKKHVVEVLNKIQVQMVSNVQKAESIEQATSQPPQVSVRPRTSGPKPEGKGKVVVDPAQNLIPETR